MSRQRYFQSEQNDMLMFAAEELRKKPDVPIRGLAIWEEYRISRNSPKTLGSLNTHFLRQLCDPEKIAECVDMKTAMFLITQLKLPVNERVKESLELDYNITITLRNNKTVRNFWKNGTLVPKSDSPPSTAVPVKQSPAGTVTGTSGGVTPASSDRAGSGPPSTTRAGPSRAASTKAAASTKNLRRAKNEVLSPSTENSTDSAMEHEERDSQNLDYTRQVEEVVRTSRIRHRGLRNQADSDANDEEDMNISESSDEDANVGEAEEPGSKRARKEPSGTSPTPVMDADVADDRSVSPLNPGASQDAQQMVFDSFDESMAITSTTPPGANPSSSVVPAPFSPMALATTPTSRNTSASAGMRRAEASPVAAVLNTSSDTYNEEVEQMLARLKKSNEAADDVIQEGQPTATHPTSNAAPAPAARAKTHKFREKYVNEILKMLEASMPVSPSEDLKADIRKQETAIYHGAPSREAYIAQMRDMSKRLQMEVQNTLLAANKWTPIPPHVLATMGGPLAVDLKKVNNCWGVEIPLETRNTCLERLIQLAEKTTRAIHLKVCNMASEKERVAAVTAKSPAEYQQQLDEMSNDLKQTVATLNFI